MPTTAQWENIVIAFSRLWNAPNFIGALDGKHVAIKCPPHSGSDFYNYNKNYYGFLGHFDAYYIFTSVDVGAYVNQGDSSIYSPSNLCAAVENFRTVSEFSTRIYRNRIFLRHYFLLKMRIL